MSVTRVDLRIVFGKVATINSQSTLPFQACADFKGESHFLRRLRYGGTEGGGRAAESHYTSALWSGDKADMFRATLGTVQGGRRCPPRVCPLLAQIEGHFPEELPRLFLN